MIRLLGPEMSYRVGRVEMDLLSELLPTPVRHALQFDDGLRGVCSSVFRHQEGGGSVG